MTKILVADDHPLFRAALKGALGFLPDAVILEASNMAEVQSMVAEHNDTDLVLLDLNMPGANGFSRSGLHAWPVARNSGGGGQWL